MTEMLYTAEKPPDQAAFLYALFMIVSSVSSEAAVSGT